jgi:hypothetical protein
MGRFYKTAQANFVDDVIYQAPHELMLNAATKTQERFDEAKSEVANNVFSDATKDLRFVKGDAQERQTIMDEYTQRAEDITSAMNSNPALYQGQLSKVNTLKREFEQNVSSGALYNMDQERQLRDKNADSITKRLDSGQIGSEKAALAFRAMDRGYGGQGTSTYGDTFDVMKEVKEVDIIADIKKTVNVSTTSSSSQKADGKGYIKGYSSATSELTADRIKSMLNTSAMMEDWRKSEQQTLGWKVAEGQMTQEEADLELQQKENDLINNAVDKLSYKNKKTSSTVGSDSTALYNRKLAEAATKNGLQSTVNVEAKNYSVPRATKYLKNSNGRFKNLKDLNTAVNKVGQSITESKGTYTPENVIQAMQGNTITVTESFVNDKGQAETRQVQKNRYDVMAELGCDGAAVAAWAHNGTGRQYNPVESSVANQNTNSSERTVENNKFRKEVISNIQDLPSNSMIKIEVFNADGTISDEGGDMTLAEAVEKGFINKNTAQGGDRERPVVNREGAFVDFDGDPLTKENEEGEMVPMTLEEIQAKNITIKTDKIKGGAVENTNVPLMGAFDQSTLSSETQWNYGNGHSNATSEDFYSVGINNATSETGGLNRRNVRVQIPKSTFQIENQ